MLPSLLYQPFIKIMQLYSCVFVNSKYIAANHPRESKVAGKPGRDTGCSAKQLPKYFCTN
jgi:hypothetical protein